MFVLLLTACVPMVFCVGIGFGFEVKTATDTAFATTFVAAVAAAAFAALAFAAVAVVAAFAALAFAAVAVVAIASSTFVFITISLAAFVFAFTTFTFTAADEMKCSWWRVIVLLLVEGVTIFCVEYLYTLPQIGWWSLLVVPFGLALEYGLWGWLIRDYPIPAVLSDEMAQALAEED